MQLRSHNHVFNLQYTTFAFLCYKLVTRFRVYCCFLNIFSVLSVGVLPFQPWWVLLWKSDLPCTHVRACSRGLPFTGLLILKIMVQLHWFNSELRINKLLLPHNLHSGAKHEFQTFLCSLFQLKQNGAVSIPILAIFSPLFEWCPKARFVSAV